MFTGIVEEVARVAAVTPLAGGRRLRFACSFAAELAVDESVAVAGVCLTVVAQDAEAFEATAVEETLSKTTLGCLAAGDGVNAERAVRLGGRLDGHLVQGHVDTTGEIVRVEALADSHLVTVAYPPEHGRLVIPRGSICVDGISLTVARLDDAGSDDAGPTFSLAIIPHTWHKTTAGTWEAGRAVNLEFDLVGKYVLRASDRADETAGRS